MLKLQPDGRLLPMVIQVRGLRCPAPSHWSSLGTWTPRSLAPNSLSCSSSSHLRMDAPHLCCSCLRIHPWPGSLPRSGSGALISSCTSYSHTCWGGHLIAEVISVATMRSLLSLHPIYKVFRVCVLSRFSYVQLCEMIWTVACQAPLSRGFSRQENWSGLPFPPPGDLPDPGIEPASLMPPALAGRFFTTSATFQHLLILHLTALQISHSQTLEMFTHDLVAC